MTAALRRLSVALLGVALAACSQPSPSQAPSLTPPTGATVAPDDASPRFVGVIGTRAQHSPPFLGVPETNFFCLRSFIDRQTGKTLHQLYVSDSYSGAERYWNAAHDTAGRPIRFVEISRHEIVCEGGCSYTEEFAADIPEGELSANPQDLSVTFTARSGDEKTIVVTGGQISAQLAAVEARRQPMQPAVAPKASAAPRPSSVDQ